MKVVDSASMSLIDRRAQEEYAIPQLVLMENAGIRAFDRAMDEPCVDIRVGSRLLFLAGRGNNGGDSLVMARQALLKGYDVGVVLASDEMEPAPRTHAEILRRLGVEMHVWNAEPKGVASLLKRADVVFDGLSGTGVKGSLRPPLSEIVHAANALDAVKVAIDIPSGIGDGFRIGYPAFRADLTLCLGLPKRCLYLPAARPLCGTIRFVELGFPPALIEDPSIPDEIIGRDDLSRMLPYVAPEAYKNVRGKIAVFAGCEGTTGAAVLCSRAAARSGVGLVVLFAESGVFDPIASQLAAVMPRRWDPTADPASLDLSSFSAILVGPGWGFAGRRPWLTRLITHGSGGVIDADALTILSEWGESIPDFGGRWVLTPHPGEFSRLSGRTKDEVLEDPYSHVRALCQRVNAVVVLKSHVTYIGSPDGRLAIVDGMNPMMGTGGSGDVLAGVIGGLMARGLSAEPAARLGVLIHDVAGKRAAAEKGWFISEDLPAFVSQVTAGL